MQITPLLSATAAKDTSSSSKTNVTGDYNKFLTLLTAQLQNQDPLAPMDASQFTNQLVQFSQVEQSVHMNESMGNMLKIQEQSQLNDAVSYVGRTVEVEGKEFSVSDGSPVGLLYAVDGTPAQASIQIFDGRGILVRTLPAPQGSGPNRIEWDAKNSSGSTVADGTYRVQITAKDQQGKDLSVQTGYAGVVSQVQKVDGAMMLSVGSSKVPLSSILTVRTPLGSKLAA